MLQQNLDARRLPRSASGVQRSCTATIRFCKYGSGASSQSSAQAVDVAAGRAAKHVHRTGNHCHNHPFWKYFLMAANHDVDTLEAFALGDRAAAVSKLVAGTEQHFQYTALLCEQRGYPEDAVAALQAFSSRNPHHPAVKAFQDRRTLQGFGTATGTAAAVELLKQSTRCSLAHERQLPRFEEREDDTPSRVGACVVRHVASRELIAVFLWWCALHLCSWTSGAWTRRSCCAMCSRRQDLRRSWCLAARAPTARTCSRRWSATPP
jgi:hypothetical protein